MLPAAICIFNYLVFKLTSIYQLFLDVDSLELLFTNSTKIFHPNMNVPGVPAMGLPPQQNPQQPQQQPPQHLDNISKIKSLIGPLRESLSNTIKSSAQTLNQNCQVDVGSLKGVDMQIPRFDKTLEEFYSICDQLELHLKTSIKCLTQGESAIKYLHLPVAPTRSENLGIPDNTLNYPQFLSTVNTQISFTKEIHDTLVAAAQNISPSE